MVHNVRQKCEDIVCYLYDFCLVCFPAIGLLINWDCETRFT